MNPIPAGAVFVGRKGAGPGVKRLFLGFWNTPREGLRGNRPERRQEAVTGRNPGPGSPTVSSTRTAGGTTMG